MIEGNGGTTNSIVSFVRLYVCMYGMLCMGSKEVRLRYVCKAGRAVYVCGMVRVIQWNSM